MIVRSTHQNMDLKNVDLLEFGFYFLLVLSTSCCVSVCLGVCLSMGGSPGHARHVLFEPPVAGERLSAFGGIVGLWVHFSQLWAVLEGGSLG